MPAFVTFGRILFAVLFIYIGVTKLYPLQETADVIAAKISVPEAVAPYTQQVEQVTGKTTPQLLAIAVGALLVIAGFMIMLNFGVRFFGMLLIIFFLVATTFLCFDLWTQAPPEPERGKMLLDALKNLSIVGALFMIVGYGRVTRPAAAAYGA